MRLLKVRLKQFRRFAEDQALDLNERLIALVGPNEAGKSSILGAIEKLGSRLLPDAVRDVTRNSPGPATISGLFELEAEDHELIAGIKGAPDIRHVRVDLRSGTSGGTWVLEPRPSRDLTARKLSRDHLNELEGDPWLDPQYSTTEELKWDDNLLKQVREQLESEEETLTPEAIQAIEDVAQRLRNIAVSEETESVDDGVGVDTGEPGTSSKEMRARRSAAREAIAAALTDLVGTERQPTPARQVIDALHNRLPDVAVFRAEDRELESAYAFDEIAADPPQALNNLCVIANLDLGQVKAARDAGRTGNVEKLFEDANASLKARYQDTWNQSKVYPRFGPPHEGTLHVWIATEGEADYSEPGERSDGLRWFIALHAFLMGLGDRRPILLVDEAETHLHYDAQADLIDALMRQRSTAQIIYSTHSVGCLPPDLGRGIRAVLPERNAERSHIHNSYWSIEQSDKDRVGYTPLLLAMGAGLLSLTVPRYAVITEGPSDAVLLPTLIREAAEVPVLRYRIVPGLADIARHRMSTLTEHAGRVVCLTDGDSAGLDLLRQVEKAGIDKAFLFNLGELRNDQAGLEDLVRSEVFAEAINRELATWAFTEVRVQPDQVPNTGRWLWLRTLDPDAEDQQIADRLSKTRVAQRIVDIKEASEAVTPLLSDDIRGPLRDLHARIEQALGA